MAIGGLSVSQLQQIAIGKSTGLYDTIRTYERLISSKLERQQIEDNPWSWNLRDLSLNEREEISRDMFRHLGLDEGSVIGAATGRDPGSAFNLARESETYAHGFGSLAMGDQSALMGTPDEVFARLMYTTSNVQLRGTVNPMARMTPRYKADFLMEQARVIHEMADPSKDFFKGKRAFVLDTETAGFSMESGIWQFSGRSMTEEGVGRLAGEISGLDEVGFSSNAVINNANMKRGMTLDKATGNKLKLTDLFERKAGSQGVDNTIIEAIDRMGDEILESQYIVGQNLSFDMPRISHDVKAALKKGGFEKNVVTRVESVLQHLESNVKLIDTQVLSQHIFQDTGENAIRVAREIMEKDKFTRFSIENVMLESNFLDLLAEDLGQELGDTGRGWDVISGMLTGEGSHSADIDTFFTGHLARIQQEHIAGRRTLMAKSLSSEGGMFKRLRQAISESTAWTPYTRDPNINNMRPVEYMVEHMRQMDRRAAENFNRSEVFYRSGMMSEWAESMTTPEGVLRDPDLLYESDFNTPQKRFMGKSIRDVALESGMDIGRYSPLEALLTTQIAQTNPAGVTDAALRNIVGDVTGSGTVKAHRGIGTIGQRNFGMSREMLEWMESTGIIDSGITEDGFRAARWSTVRAPQKRGLALVVDPFKKGADGVDQLNQIRAKFIEDFDAMDEEEFLKKFSVKKDVAKRALAEMGDNVLDYGVQIGFLDDKSGKLVNAFEAQELGLDNTDSLSARTYAFAGRSDNYIHTTATYLDTGAGTVEEDLLQGARRTRELVELAQDDIARNPVKRVSIMLGMGRADNVKRMYDFMSSSGAKRGGVGALAALGAYYLYGKKQEQDPYDATMEFGGWDTGQLNGMTEYEQRSSPLATAGVVRGLDYNKISHQKMDTSSKYDHLF